MSFFFMWWQKSCLFVARVVVLQTLPPVRCEAPRTRADQLGGGKWKKNRNANCSDGGTVNVGKMGRGDNSVVDKGKGTRAPKNGGLSKQEKISKTPWVPGKTYAAPKK